MKNIFLLSKFRNPEIKYKSIYLLSNTCNRKCKFCYYDFNKYFIKSKLNLKLLKQYKPDLIYFSGGEPFASNEIWKYLFNLGIKVKRITIFTNGDLIDWTTIALLTEYTDNINLIINNGEKLFESEIENCIVWNKIFVNDDKYVRLLDVVENHNIVFSFELPSYYSRFDFKPNYNIDWNKIEEFIKNHNSKRITLFEPFPLIEKSISWYSSKDYFDHFIYFPYFKKDYKKQIGTCLKCKAKDNYELCYNLIMDNKCPRIPKKCFLCKYNHVCLVPQSRFKLIDVDNLDCERSLIPLFELFLKYKLF